MAEPLKPCPFCGGKAEIKIRILSKYSAYYDVSCRGCGISHGSYLSKDYAFMAWNRRTAITQDRQSRGEPVAWAYEYQKFGDVWARHVILNRPDGGANPPTKHHDGPIRNVVPLFAPQPAEPSYVESDYDCTVCGRPGSHCIDIKRCPHFDGKVVLDGKQPAEPVKHDLFKTGDKGAPEQILDRNGEVVLDCCKRCGKAEAELSESCAVEPVKWPSNDDLVNFMTQYGDAMGHISDVQYAEVARALLDRYGNVAQPVERPGKIKLFPIDVFGNPMREYASGKWENAVWPSDLPVQPAASAEPVYLLGEGSARWYETDERTYLSWKMRGSRPVKKLYAQPVAAQHNVTDDMVSRFLGWKLPDDFAPDCGISFKPLGHPNGWPIGTHLLTAPQARAMLEYVLQVVDRQ